MFGGGGVLLQGRKLVLLRRFMRGDIGGLIMRLGELVRC
jgi:hypothetical protein